QAEDGIRDRNVTGVQTCALPICICRRLFGPHARVPCSSDQLRATGRFSRWAPGSQFWDDRGEGRTHNWVDRWPGARDWSACQSQLWHPWHSDIYWRIHGSSVLPWRRLRCSGHAGGLAMTRQISPLHWGETRFYRRLVRDENVLGWGVAEKLRYGVATGDSAVTIYVERKVSAHKVPQRDRFPSFVRTSYGRMPIDIVSLGPRQSEGSATVDVAYHARPVPIGVEIGIDGGPPGTLGCLV